MGRGCGPQAALEHPNTLGGTAIKPVERHGLEAIRWFLYDPEKGAIMGRTPMSWLKIIVFYIIYYIFLSVFWLLMLFVFFFTIDNHSPKWQNANGIIGKSPGLGLRPYQDFANIDSSMIIFNKDSSESYKSIPGYSEWALRSQRFLDSYKPINSTVCKEGDGEDAICSFDVSTLGECAEEGHGYSSGRPCIFLKLNRIYGLKNVHYTKADEFPGDAPEELKEHVETVENKEQVWIHCRGENSGDIESLGPIAYYPPSRGFPDRYFPYLNQPNYLSPIVAVQFLEPAVGQLLHIECRAWAENIAYSRMDRLGIVHLELMLHDKMTIKTISNPE
ncbi:sodium/potassium-transporting ATPase subunit beta [Lepeophtheirus salmonis]|nr:sodium/potassium-transporting ATPase subunit beta-like [Lepeophtheirus salmonis]XP_040583161.1 sodium/potassium-transporting ATPase subunit beta-like [Lepeophtheirus salmonis]XP_040583162.1 sodium/potassium-transporting ATPase subunit beta-like [Lepeophtheirus salmonis]